MWYFSKVLNIIRVQMYSGKSRQDVGTKMFVAGSVYDPDDAMLVVFKQGCKKFCV